MSDLNRLRELAALLQPKREPVAEAKSPTSDFDGIKAVVDDALADLHDKLGEGGALETLLDKSGLSGLDKNTDHDGKTILERLSVRTAQYKKEVDNLLTEVELMLASDTSVHESLQEMADASKFHGNPFKRTDARMLIKQFKGGEETFDIGGDKYTAKKAVNGGALEAGMQVFAAHDSTNTGAELYQVMGFSGGEGTDDDTVKFKSAKEAMKACGVTNLAGLGDKGVRLIVKDMADGDEGGFFYVYKGRWAYGSGAEPLSFTLVQKV